MELRKTFKEELDEIVKDPGMSVNMKRVKAGKLVKQRAKAMREAGYFVEEIAAAMGIRESRIRQILEIEEKIKEE